VVLLSDLTTTNHTCRSRSAGWVRQDDLVVGLAYVMPSSLADLDRLRRDDRLAAVSPADNCAIGAATPVLSTSHVLTVGAARP
jgi:hypothetical protein